MSSAVFTKSAVDAEPARPGKTPLNRTCQGCRKRKIKCILRSQNGETEPLKCSRCSKFALECVFLPPATKRTRRRNETRIRELEQKLQDFQNAFTDSVEPPTIGNEIRREPQSGRLEIITSVSNHDETPLRREFPNGTASDPIARGIMDSHLAEVLYCKFRDELASIYPLVLLPTAYGWKDARIERPALFRALLAAAASSVSPELSRRLFDDTVKYLADEVVSSGRKSLDLAQGLLLMSTWHFPPDKFEELKFGQLAHMAATMIADLRSSNDVWYKVPREGACSVHSEQLKETCRTYVATYFLCSSISLSHRRQAMIRYGPWIEDCFRVLHTPPMHPNDHRLVEWTRLQRIAEKGMAVVGFDEESTADFTDARTRFILKDCVEKATQWREKAIETVNDAMDIHYHMIRISLYEPVLYDGNDLEDFRPPYKLCALSSRKKACTETSVETSNGLRQCTISAQTIVHTFLSLSVDSLRSVPVIIYVRLSYAVIVLLKMKLSSQTPQPAADPSHKDIDIQDILSQLIEKLHSTTGPERFQVPATFLGVLSRVKSWYSEHERSSFLGPDDIMEPMIQLGIEDESTVEDTYNPIQDTKPGQYTVEDATDVQQPELHSSEPAVLTNCDYSGLLEDSWLSMMSGDPYSESSESLW